MREIKAYRHGDVVLVQVQHDPRWSIKYRPEHDQILARGEMTDHTHRLATLDPEEELLVARGFSKLFGESWFLKVPTGGAKLTHEEHERIDLPKGDYVAFQQRESWEDQQVRRVYD